MDDEQRRRTVPVADDELEQSGAVVGERGGDGLRGDRAGGPRLQRFRVSLDAGAQRLGLEQRIHQLASAAAFRKLEGGGAPTTRREQSQQARHAGILIALPDRLQLRRGGLKGEEPQLPVAEAGSPAIQVIPGGHRLLLGATGLPAEGMNLGQPETRLVARDGLGCVRGGQVCLQGRLGLGQLAAKESEKPEIELELVGPPLHPEPAGELLGVTERPGAAPQSDSRRAMAASIR